MKVCIVTPQLMRNYGNRLQAYATQKVLNDLGYECVFYRHVKPIKTSPIKNLLQEFTDKHMAITNKGEHDIVIVGSDQVWNPINRKNPYPKSRLKIAYSASFGLSKIPMNYRDEIYKKVRDMDIISVREDRAIEQVKQITGKDVIKVIDPTMMLPEEEWKKLIVTPKEKKYLFLYLLPRKDNEQINDLKIISYVENFAIDNGLSIIRPRWEKGTQHQVLSVEEWLGYLYNADVVFSNSFHVSVFSILFKKPFLTYDNRPNEGERFKTLFKMFGIDCWLNDKEDFNKLKCIRYDNNDFIIEQERKKAINFLRGGLCL